MDVTVTLWRRSCGQLSARQSRRSSALLVVAVSKRTAAWRWLAVACTTHFKKMRELR